VPGHRLDASLPRMLASAEYRQAVAGLTVAAAAGPGQRIELPATAIVAFVGRALRGPINRPLFIESFAEYEAVFGGLWQPSTLSYAVEQYFANGGRGAQIVRVANSARSATLELPVSSGAPLVLEAVCPGTREFLRAAVDYDNVPPDEVDTFNLVVQRVRTPGSEYVEDQEIYTRASVNPDSMHYVGLLLQTSALVRVVGPPPLERPLPTLRADLRAFVAYVSIAPNGSDGVTLTDYDVIGSASERTGLFAFTDDDVFDFLYVPPLSRETPVGASALLVAQKLCRSRRSLLMIDPPADWSDPQRAVLGQRQSPHASDQALMFYPWVEAFDRLRGRSEAFPPGAAALGMLARLTADHPPWVAGAAEDAPLRPGFRPVSVVPDGARERLASVGINTLSSVRSTQSIAARTLAGARTSSPEWCLLSRRRLALTLVESLLRGTRWVLFEPPGPATWRRLGLQVAELLARLERDGAFPEVTDGAAWFVVCDERVNRPNQVAGTSVLFGYAGVRGVWHSWLVTHGPTGTSVQQASINRLLGDAQHSVEEPWQEVAETLVRRLAR
jgi:uncharacterized protein